MKSHVPTFPPGLTFPASELPLRFEFKTLTPVIGCGVQSGELDKITPVRGTAVRGHLRFWWRATCGRRFGTTAVLRAEENSIWGSSSCRSRVIISTTVTQHEEKSIRDAEGLRNEYPSYVFFPFVPPMRDKYPEVWSSLSFTLSIWTPAELIEEVETSVWAWANFGGIGSRTRRGCGALFCAELSPPIRPGNDWVAARLERYPIHADCKLWPHLASEPLLKKYEKNARLPMPLLAWSESIKVLQEFRQASDHGEGAGKVGRGRSSWPEADSLRHEVGREIPANSNVTNDHAPTRMSAFPRAELGLPYEILFKDHEDEKYSAKIYPEDSNRMASPVICRPLMLGPNGRTALPMIVVLSAPTPRTVRIKPNSGKASFSASVDWASGLAQIDSSPDRDVLQTCSALEAFTAFAKGRFLNTL